jgi:thiol-disulfide isomerase/thioredoxin
VAETVETVLEPVISGMFEMQHDSDFATQAIMLGEVSPGQTFASESDYGPFAEVYQEIEVLAVEEVDGQPVCRTRFERETYYAPFLALLGLGYEEVEGEMAYLANGFPLEMTGTATMVLKDGQEVVTTIEMVLTGQEGAGEALLQKLQEKLMAAAMAEDYGQAIEVLLNIMDLQPENPDLWLQLAQLREAFAFQVSQGTTSEEAARLFIEAGSALERYLELDPEGAERAAEIADTLFYNQACGHAVLGHPEAAMAALERSIQAGWNDADHLESDPDLMPLHGRDDFHALVRSLRERAASEAREQVAELLADFEPFDFDFALTDLEGNPIALKDFAGKVVIVDIWGTWCPPCRAEVPHFVDLYDRYHEAGLEIVGLNYEGVEGEEAVTKVKAFIEEHKIPYPCALGDEATKERVPEFRGYPTTLFVGRDGKVRLKLVGYQEMAVLEAIVTTLLDEEQG